MTRRSLERPHPLRSAYVTHKQNARRRGIPWEFIFDSWLKTWADSGKLDQRGRGRGKYCMARRGDVGAYSPENVVIKTHEENLQEGFESAPFLERENTIGEFGGIAWGKGYTRDSRQRSKPWKAQFRHKMIGLYATEAEARAAFVRVATDYLNSKGIPIPDTLKA